MIPPERIVATLMAHTILSDSEIQDAIVQATQNSTLPSDIVRVDGVPYHNEQIFVPDNREIRKHIMALYHDSPLAGHLGQSGTIDLIQRRYWWPKMGTEIRDYIRSCNVCAQHKHTNQRPTGTLQVLPAPEGPWQWTQSDHVTSLPKSKGHDAIYVVMDRFTKMAHFIPTSTRATAEDLAQLHLAHIWKLHGVPRIHNTDRGPLFTAEYTRRFFRGLGIDQRFSTPYHPQTQGQVENLNKWMETYIRMFCNKQQNNWADLLLTAEFAYNNHSHPTIGMTPFRVNHGYDLTLTGEGPTRGADIPLRLNILTCLHERCKGWILSAQKKQEIQYAKRVKDAPPLKVDDLVWISSRDLLTDRPSAKLEALRYGPYPIIEVKGPLMYRVKLLEGWRVHDTFHRSKLTPAW